jgi:hypothetical protein
MSPNTNGHTALPEGAVIATLDMLRAANTATVRCPRLSEATGQEVVVRIRAIRRAAYLQMLPPPPPEAEAWPKDPEARAQAMLAWLAALPEPERGRRQAAIDAVTDKVLAAGLAEPAVDLDGARAFGDDADLVAVEILQLSGILPKPTASAPVEATVPEVAGA